MLSKLWKHVVEDVGYMWSAIPTILVAWSELNVRLEHRCICNQSGGQGFRHFISTEKRVLDISSV
jgi:hypothetical protein